MYLQGFIILYKTLTFIICIHVYVYVYLLHNNKLKVMKKLERIAKYLNKLKENYPNSWFHDCQDMLDLAESGLAGEITHKVARTMIYKMCTAHMDSGIYEQVDFDISLMCLPVNTLNR